MEIDEIKSRIEELKAISEKSGIDISAEYRSLLKKLESRSFEDSVWSRVEIARHAKRPTTLDYVGLIFDDFLELHGDRLFADDPAMVGGLALLDGLPVTIIGHQKGRNVKENIERNFGMAHPEGYRKALRLAEQAEKFGRPLIEFLDTPGAFCGIAAEERGIGRAIAVNLKRFSTLKVPIVTVVIGEGGSGGALGIGVGDVLIMLENAIYSVISPEGCASILLRDSSKAKEAAKLMKLTAFDLKELGIADRIVPEPPGGAHENPEEVATTLKKEISKSIENLWKRSQKGLLKERRKRLMSVGVF